jgi:hypothetical protein
MGPLQAAFDNAMGKLTQLGVEKIVSEKLSAAGIEDRALTQRISSAVLDGTAERLNIEYGQEVHLVFDDADFRRLEKTSKAFSERLPELIRTMTDEASDVLAASFREQWRETGSASAATEAVAKQIARTWAKPLDALHMLVALCAQEGDAFNIAHLKSKRTRDAVKNQAIARLHIRACRIANEILLLLEHGHTEGAQARWRTLHEVTITATVIAEGGNALAQRYFDHEAIDRKKALDDHRRAAEAAGTTSLGSRETAAIEREERRIVAKYDKQFRGMYGWASGQLGLPREPQFHHLQEVAGSLSMKLRYRLSSFDIHASPNALSQPVHQWDPTTHIPGVFSAGFEGPGVDTAQAIVQITALLYPMPLNLDQLAFMMALTQLRDETALSWQKVEQRIARQQQRALELTSRRAGPIRRSGFTKSKPGPRRV